jgi:predicted DNA-binding transcriptional regulator AlpA
VTTNLTPLDTAAAAEYVGLSKSTLEKLRCWGTGPKYLKLNRAVRYRVSDLEGWLNERLVSSTSEPPFANPATPEATK